MARKFVVTALRRCKSCLLLYRTPVDKISEADDFYNEDYVQGNTTNLPSLEKLEEMKASNFSDLESDYKSHADLIRKLGVEPGAQVFDYGCSWGYGSYLLAKAGFHVKSYEISRKRRMYGQKNLDIDLTDDFEAFAFENASTFDVFFSSHVLEHVPSPTKIVEASFHLLKPGGLFISCFPNGSGANRRANPMSWQGLWGEVHPNFLDNVYLKSLFNALPHVLAVSPFEIAPLITDHLNDGAGTLTVGNLVGYELFVIAKKPES